MWFRNDVRVASMFFVLVVGCSGGSGSSTAPPPMAVGTATAGSNDPTPTAKPSATPTATASPSPAVPTAFPASSYTAQPADVTVVSPTKRVALFNPTTPVSSLGTIGLPNAYAMTRIRPGDIAQLDAAHRFSSTQSGDHEAVGTFFEDNRSALPPYDAVFAVQTAYEASQAPLVPHRTTDFDQGFLPTVHFGTCLETSTYQRFQNGTLSSHFTVFNFCLSTPTFIFDTPIDAAFLNAYVRIDPATHRQSYATEIFTPDPKSSSSSQWYSVLYNFQSQQWDRVIDVNTNGKAPEAGGWSIFETYFNAGICPKTAPVGTGDDLFYNSSTGHWDPAAPQMAPGLNTSASGNGSQCFASDSTGPQSEIFTLDAANTDWNVYSPR